MIRMRNGWGRPDGFKAAVDLIAMSVGIMHWLESSSIRSRYSVRNGWNRKRLLICFLAKGLGDKCLEVLVGVKLDYDFGEKWQSLPLLRFRSEMAERHGWNLPDLVCFKWVR